MANTHTKHCKTCGAPFEASRSDYTVNCPAHRGRPTATPAPYRPAPLDRHALGYKHGLAGEPRVGTGMRDYHRGYDEGEAARHAKEV
jgi:hypothetical protein